MPGFGWVETLQAMRTESFAPIIAMIPPAYRKIFLYGLVLSGIVIMMTMPDVVIGLLFELVHFFFELLFHIADVSYEWIESILDNIVEHLFQTELHETQTIVFYLMAGIIVLPLYYLWRMLLRLFFRLKKTLQAAHEEWGLYKTRAAFYWQELPLINKATLVAVFVVIIYLASFLFF